jgi:hypothetical protein
MKHTPGPWIVHDHAPASVWAGDEHVATCNWWIDPAAIQEGEPDYRVKSATKREANARLIAAAPDMLEAMKNLLDLFDPYGPEAQRAAKQARAVIAKAEGRSHG